MSHLFVLGKKVENFKMNSLYEPWEICECREKLLSSGRLLESEYL